MRVFFFLGKVREEVEEVEEIKEVKIKDNPFSLPLSPPLSLFLSLIPPISSSPGGLSGATPWRRSPILLLLLLFFDFGQRRRGRGGRERG